MRKKEVESLWLIVLALFLIVVIAPGTLLVTIIRILLSIDLDTGQVWVFSVLSSLIFYIILWYILRTLDKNQQFIKKYAESGPAFTALLAYVVISLSIVALGMILYWGFHVRFPARIINSLLGQP